MKCLEMLYLDRTNFFNFKNTLCTTKLSSSVDRWPDVMVDVGAEIV